MTYTHLTTDELVMIESHYRQNIKIVKAAEYLKRSQTPIYSVIDFLKRDHTALEYYQRYKENEKQCGRRNIVLPKRQQSYIKKKIAQGWTPDVIIGRKEKPISCSVRTLYRQFKERVFDEPTLPMKSKRKPNGHQERRGEQTSKRNIVERETDYPTSEEEFGHIEGDTTVGIHHKSAVIALVERLSKIIITLKPEGCKAIDIESTLNHWLGSIPRHLFKSTAFDCGEELSNWKALSNQHDIATYFADPGTPSQRALNENSNGSLQKDGLPKDMDFNQVDQAFIFSVTNKRNNVPRKSLDYQILLEVFMGYMNEDILSSLI